MNHDLHDRYVPDTRLYEGVGGQLYRGHDSLLKRDVLIYLVSEKAVPSERVMHGEAALEILSRGETTDGIFYVLEYIPGLLLSQAGVKLSLKEALGMSRQFVSILLEACAVRGRGLRLTADNLWLTETGEVKVIDSWSVDEAAIGHEIEQVFRLIHYIMFGDVKLVLPPAQIIEELALSYAGDPFIIRKSLRGMARRAEKKAADRYEEMLAQTFEDITALYQYIKNTQLAAGKKAVDIPVKKERIVESEEPPQSRLRDTRRERAAMRGQKKKKRSNWTMPRIPARIITMLAIGLVLLIGGVAAFSGSGTDSKAQTPATDKPVAGVEVPDVGGMTLAEAGQKLDAAGIRYKYYLESSFSKTGTVFKQNPQAGERISRVDSVELWVSQ
ncbi:PASTA domain-containing protein [Aneurinibacillus soli]|uniref:PASTA domain protein n=1 Tax=Aneurinibacillus soli TaxID=1500254 RepID=A0A0U5AX85_9BACL|nr:PASTA domain-containing protein [Aneurinibacillus soli]PYE64392.1 PASTA domain-containing protein [Aneurinibacillus soli]BAU28341.1 PASTA domain protein [Aneurinibacillus soli]